VKSYHRFNLGRETAKDSATKDDWYTRLGISSDASADKNSEKAINNLTALGDVYRIGAPDDFTIQTNREKRGGIPALRLTANDKGSFDTLENRRRQIAANLNDYCDADYKPTVKEDGENILYSGNERTLYINELGIGGVLRSKPDHISSAFNENPGIDLQLVKPGVVAELVNIYGEDKDIYGKTDVNKLDANVDKYTFDTKIYLTAEVTVTPVIRIKYRPSAASVGEPQTTPDVTLDPVDETLVCGSAADPWEVKIDGAAGKWVKNNNYWTGVAQNANSSEEKKIELKDACEKALKKLHSSASFVSAAVTSYKIKMKSLKFGVKRMTLSASLKDNTTGSTIYETAVDYVNAPKSDTELAALVTEPSELTVTNGSAAADTYYPFLIGRMEAKDPRQNLNINVSDATLAACQSSASFQKSDWFFEPRVKFPCDNTGAQKELDLGTMSGVDHFTSLTGKLLAGNQAGSGNVDGFEKAISLSGSALNSGSTNLFGNPKNTLAGGDETTLKADREVAKDSAWEGSEGDKHISTAYVRNAPMRSPWELGAIHRGAVWETLNIARSASGQKHAPDANSNDVVGWSADGRSYDEGDGILLDQIKMVPYAQSLGKVNLNLMNQELDRIKPELRTDLNKNTFYNANVTYAWMGRALLDNLRLGQRLDNFTASSEVLSSASTPPADTFFDTATVTNAELKTLFQRKFRMSNRSEWLAPSLNPEGTQDAVYLKIREIYNKATGIETAEQTDAEREEIVGKIINLLGTTPSLPSEFKAVVVAQTIKDIGGEDSAENVTKVFGEDGEDDRDCKIGTFDVTSTASGKMKYHYFDEITGEVKMLVTFRRDPETGRITVRSTEYID